MGHVISADGLAWDAEKVCAIQDMHHPTNGQGIQQLLGFVNYLTKFFPKLSTVCSLLRRLVGKDTKADQRKCHEDAFAEIKQLVTEALILKLYKAAGKVTIVCHSSQVGLGAVLMQDGWPVAYASWALTRKECNYAQIERVPGQTVFATHRFEYCILGKNNVTVLTDHKPLVLIINKPILTSPKCLQRLWMSLQKYTLSAQTTMAEHREWLV